MVEVMVEEMRCWMKHKLKSKLLGEISTTLDIQMTPPLWQKAKTQRASWWKGKRRVKKIGLKLNIQKTNIMASNPTTLWQIDGETMTDFFFSFFFGGGASKITADGDCSHEIKRHLFLGRKAMTKFSSVQFSRSVVSDSLWPHELQHTRPPCPSPTPRVYSNSCPSSWWCHPAISSPVVPFSSCPQSLPASESFPMNQFFA